MGWARPSEVEEALGAFHSALKRGMHEEEAFSILPELSRNHRKTLMAILRREGIKSKHPGGGHGDQRDVLTRQVREIAQNAALQIRSLKRIIREESKAQGTLLSRDEKELLVDAFHSSPGQKLSMNHLYHAHSATAHIVSRLENARQESEDNARYVEELRFEALMKIEELLERAAAPAAISAKHMSYAIRALGIRYSEPPTSSGWKGERQPPGAIPIDLDGDDDLAWRTENPENIAQRRSHRSGKRWSPRGSADGRALMWHALVMIGVAAATIMMLGR